MAKKTEATNKQPSNVKTEPFTRELLIALTREEIEERSQRMTHVMFRRSMRADEVAEERKAQKRELKLMDIEIRHICNEVRAKSAERTVSCERRFLYDEKKVVEVRTDTGDVLAERAMTLDELALELPFSDDEEQSSNGIDNEFGGAGA